MLSIILTRWYFFGEVNGNVSKILSTFSEAPSVMISYMIIFVAVVGQPFNSFPPILSQQSELL